ncbi:ABC transporter ATP-binding protein [Micromonospora sp. NPDC049903]|uniref:ABC transporter ATP-binding protein n=1 Tax=Micromonospora sp. NPDC049903 TaxID=3364276 RepID=UPI0037B5E3A3
MHAVSGAEIHITGLVKHFRTGTAPLKAVNDVTLEITAGSMVALTGPSGSGKSTLLHLIGAIEQADAGTIRIDDLKITTLRRAALATYRRQVGFVFQRFHLLPALTVLDNVIAPVLPYRTRGADHSTRARELLADVGLTGRERALPAQLSGGQQQRVAIARALMAKPRLLLADEPTGNLDSTTGNQILALLQRLRAEHQMTIILATHDQRIAARCDRLLRLTDGQIVDDLDLTNGEDPTDTLSRANRLRL